MSKYKVSLTESILHWPVEVDAADEFEAEEITRHMHFKGRLRSADSVIDCEAEEVIPGQDED